MCPGSLFCIKTKNVGRGAFTPPVAWRHSQIAGAIYANAPPPP